jgi:hypothetical protein
VAAIDAVSRRPGEAYFDYIRRAAANKIARTMVLSIIRD